MTWFNDSNMLWWVIAIGFGDIVASPIRVPIEEFVKDYCSKRFGWFKGYRATTEIPEQIEKLLKKLGKKRGYKKAVKKVVEGLQQEQEKPSA